jgi:predicted methyltransferase MtxX (methanogen marker protein 4)
MREIERIEKIEVNVMDGSKEHKLLMNKFLSTPFNCAMRETFYKIKICLEFKFKIGFIFKRHF